MQTLRIFISSPGDVADERQIAVKVIERLQGKYLTWRCFGKQKLRRSLQNTCSLDGTPRDFTPAANRTPEATHFQIFELSMNHQKEYRYWAFISYSSKDSAIGSRLHRALEHDVIPRQLRGRPSREGDPIPVRLFPIFRDRDELPLSSDLGSTIHDALQASRYLVVICSPDAAKSYWVNEEVRHFQSIGKGREMRTIGR